MPDFARVRLTLRALAPAVVGSVVASVAGLYVFRRVVPVDWLRESNDVMGNYLQTVGTIYAVLLAFVVVVVWQQFNDMRNFIEREANEVLDLFRTASGFSEPVRGELQTRLRAYVDAVLKDEWPAMTTNENAIFERVWRLFDEVAEVLHRCEPHAEREASLYSEALARLNDLSDVRAGRLSASRMRIPLALHILLDLGAVIVVGSMYLFAVQDFLIHALMTAAMAGAVSHVLYIIHDLDHAFAGDWQVPRDSFEHLRTFINASDGRSS
jgi:Protein of unknown function (DUF4239)